MADDWDLEIAQGSSDGWAPAQQAPQPGGWAPQPAAGAGWVGRGRGRGQWNGGAGAASQSWGANSGGQSWGANSGGQTWGANSGGQTWGASRGVQSGGAVQNGSGEAWGSQQRDTGDSRPWRGRGGRRGGSESQNWRSAGGGGDRGPPAADSVYMMVAAADVSRIIGRAGANIKELEANSGARIKIDRDAGNFDEARVDFVGDRETQERAKLLVEQFLIDSAGQDDRPRRGRGGRSPSPVPRKGLGDTEDLPPIIQRPAFNLQAALVLQAEYEKERWSKCPKLIKDFYQEDPAVASMSAEEVESVRKELNDINVSCDDSEARLLNPVTTFDQAFRPYPEILTEIKKAGFESPTPIQAQAWPVLLSGQDLIGIAQTGSGKTLAFLLPALIHTDLQPLPRADRGGPNVLVLSPTRELAMQTEKEVEKYNYKGIRSVCVYGGGDRRNQVKAVCKGVEIVIATPGRLNDLVQAGYIDVTSITYLVLDEADRMLDMGFEPEIRKVLLDIRPDRQTVMTSATWPVDVRRMAEKYMKSPVHVVVGTLDLRACRTVEQIITFCQDEEEKKEKLDKYLYNMGPEEKIIVFFGRKAKASQLSIDYGVNGVDLQSIHGDRPQEEREIAIEDMQTGSCRVLFATDVASRGIDIPDVTLIINYDFPRHIEDYVHRIGRTGRAGKSGRAVTLMVREDWRHAGELIEILQRNEAEVPDWLEGMSDRFTRMKERREAEGGDRRGRGGRDGYRGGGGGREGFGGGGREGYGGSYGGGGGGRSGGGRRFGGGGRGRRDFGSDMSLPYN